MYKILIFQCFDKIGKKRLLKFIEKHLTKHSKICVIIGNFNKDSYSSISSPVDDIEYVSYNLNKKIKGEFFVEYDDLIIYYIDKNNNFTTSKTKQLLKHANKLIFSKI